jgi:peptide/nickel transport system substrate-binding protein
LLGVASAATYVAGCGGAVAPTAPAPEAPAAGEAPAAAPKPAGQVADVPRNRTLFLMWAGREGKYIDHELWNPYAVGANHQNGPGIFYEPLYFFSAFANKMIPWLAESFEYNSDYTELTIKTRSGVTWSDGVPFSAEDVAFTLNALRDQGGKVRWGVDVQQFVEEAKAVDENTVFVKLKVPAPRFFYFLTYKFDIGVYMVPKHIFENVEDWSTFTHFDLDKGWPVTTGPWKLVFASPEQKIIDRRDDWWAARAGLTEMPKVERIVYLPFAGETQAAQALITNQIDAPLDLRPRTIKQVLAQNPAIITHSGKDLPYGYVDWWPTSLYLNNEKPPFDNPDVRWAISYFIDRQQVVDVGYEGAGSISKLPMPSYPPLLPYFEAIEDLLALYDTTEFNPAKGAERLEKAGFKKDGEGFWVDANGQRITLPINGWTVMADIGPVVAELLKRQGIDATYQMPVDAGDQFTQGTYIGQLSGHGGSVEDPYFTMRLYQTATKAVPGAHLVNFSRWKNDEYDGLVDQMAQTPMEDTETLKELFHQVMEVWLPNLPDVQITEWYHRIPMNTTYWQGWPTQENPYVNGAFWHLTFQLILNKLQPTQ